MTPITQEWCGQYKLVQEAVPLGTREPSNMGIDAREFDVFLSGSILDTLFEEHDHTQHQWQPSMTFRESIAAEVSKYE